MKTRMLAILFNFLLIAGNIHAANGDLTVNGTINAGAGGIKFSDGSTQTTAKRLVWDYTVTGSAVSSVTSPTLDGHAHGGYEFEFIIYNSTGGNVSYRMYYNNDTTNLHYMWARQYAGSSHGGTATGGGPVYDAFFDDTVTGADNAILGVGNIIISPAGHVAALYKTSRAGFVLDYMHRKIAAVADLSRIDIVANTAGGIGVNSRFRMWRRM